MIPSRRLLVLAIALALVLAPSRADEPAARGAVLAIGGGKLDDEIVDRFVALARGKAGGRIAVCTAASESVEGPEVARFRERGVAAVEVADFRSRAEADDPARAARLEGASGIFFTGGDQRRLLETLRGSRALESVRGALRRGAVVAGTSAGAAVLGDLAITGDGEGAGEIRAGATPTVEGLGFLPGTIVDQHFLARRRQTIDSRSASLRGGRSGPRRGPLRLVSALLALEVVGAGIVSIYVPATGERAFSLRLLARGERFTPGAK